MRQLLLFGFLILIGLTGCSPSASDIVERHFKELGDTSLVQSIYTKAICKGPDGKYITQTESSFSSDYLLFKQDYLYKNPFYAVVYTMESAFGLDSVLQSKGSLSKPVIGVLKAHEFHELSMQFHQRYKIEEKLDDTVFFDVPCRRLKGIDPLELPVILFFNKQTGLMEGFSQVNAYKKTELIQVHFEDWFEMDGVRIFDKLTILQGEKSKFSFDYEVVMFNSPDYTEIQVGK